MTKVFILGAPDPEMEEIERVVRAQNFEVRYALCHQICDVPSEEGAAKRSIQRLTRVRAEHAYNADAVSGPIPKGSTIIFVECEVLGLQADVLIDHHREGDPGYKQPPQNYLAASSLGQTLNYLGLEATEEQRIIAAADHCPTQAYLGLCPGVETEALKAWRTASRAARRGVTPSEMDAAIERAKSVLQQAERLQVGNAFLPWVRDRKGEICEASARFNIPFLYAESLDDGRTKMGIMGAAPDTISTWMQECGLENVYGDPVRGYAGGYLY